MLVPYTPSTPTYKLQVKTRSEACTHGLPRVLRYRTLPPSKGGLRGYHVSSGSRFRLPDRKGFDAAMCIVAPNMLRGLWCTMYPMVSDPNSLRGGLRAATHPMVPCGPRASNIKKSLASLPVQLGSHVPNAHA
jgi:hypothetical protein